MERNIGDDEADRESATRPVAASAPPLRTADEALRSGDPALALKAHVLRAVVALVPATAALFVGLSRRRRIEDGVVLVDPEDSLDRQSVWAHHGGGARGSDPFAPSVVEQPGVTVLSLGQVEERAPGYAERLRAAGWADRMVMYLRGSGMVFGMVSLLRTEQEARFTAPDASSLRQIHSLIEHAYVAAVEPAGDAGTSFNALRESGLTEREAEVAELIGRGASNADIARALHLSPMTVKTHLTHIYAKVGVHSRTQLAILVGATTGRLRD